MKFKVEFQYRDACNYKDWLVKELDGQEYPLVNTYEVGDEVEMEHVDIQWHEICKHAFNPSYDHNLLEIMAIEEVPTVKETT